MAPPLAWGQADLQRLERSWQSLDQQLRALDALIPPDREPRPDPTSPAAPLPKALLAPNAAPQSQLQPSQAPAPAPLSLPNPAQLEAGRVQGLSLMEALGIGFANNPQLQAQRLQVAAALDQLQARLGTYWPRISAVASGNTGQSSSYNVAPVGNGNLGLGPLFSPGGAFYVPSGGEAYFNQASTAGAVGLELDYALIDFARTPAVQAARANLERERQRYGNQLRQLQLQISEAYYQLQQADQNVRIQDAAVRNDLLILQDALDLKLAGLVPRLDVLRRRAIEASDQEALIQAMADRAIARRRLAVVLNLPAEINPSASDPIAVMPSWPLNLEQSLLAAYRGNPELETILAVQTALARQRDVTAAQLLPRLALFAGGGSYGQNVNQFNVTASNGGCCGSAVIPTLNSSGYDWAVGLSLRWLLFDAGTTSGEARALQRRVEAAGQDYAATRNAIRLRLESAFFNHEASLAKLSSARRGVAAALEAFRDVRLRYQTGLSSELDLSVTQERLISSLVQRLNATVGVNISYAQLLRELLPVPRDPAAPLNPALIWQEPTPAGAATRPQLPGSQP
ncbi:MAG: TolC family protein [Vulcanococcus sp.]